MDNFQPNTLRRVVSFNSVRAHDCPNCQCTVNHTSNHQVLPRAPSPGISFRNLKSFPVSKPTTCFVNRPIIYQNNHGRQNFIKPPIAENSIYLKKTDMVEESSSNFSLMRTSASKRSIQKPNIRIVSPAKNSPNHVNIRYVSPPRNLRQNINSNIENYQSNVQSKNKIEQKKLPSIYFQKPIYKQQKSSISQPQQPKKPNILLKKNSQNKKQKLKIQQNPSPTTTKHSLTQACHNSEKQMEKQLEIGLVSTITNRNAIRSYPYTNDQVKNLWKKGSQPFDIIISEEEDKQIASQIMKDLKLNYDYYSTRDISRIMSKL